MPPIHFIGKYGLKLKHDSILNRINNLQHIRAAFHRPPLRQGPTAMEFHEISWHCTSEHTRSQMQCGNKLEGVWVGVIRLRNLTYHDTKECDTCHSYVY